MIPADKTYAVTDGEYIKVGRAWNVEQRIRSLQTASARTLVLIAVHESDVEKHTHRRLVASGVIRIKGEWFEDTDDARRVLSLIGFSSLETDECALEAASQRDFTIGWECGYRAAVKALSSQVEEHW